MVTASEEEVDVEVVGGDREAASLQEEEVVVEESQFMTVQD